MSNADVADPRNSDPILVRLARTYRVTMRLMSIVWREEKMLFSALWVAMIIPACIPFVNAYIYKLLIDSVVLFTNTQHIDYNLLYWLFAIRGVTFLVQDMAFRSQDYISRLLWTKLPMTISQLILKKVAHLDLQFFEDSDFKNLIEKVRESAGHRPQNLIENVMYSVQSLIQVVIATVALTHLSPYLVLVIACVAVPEFLIQTRLAHLSWGIWSWQSPLKKRFWYLTHLLHNAASVKEIKLFELSQTFLQDLKQIHTSFYRDNITIARKNYIVNTGFNIVSSVVFICVEGYALFQVLKGKISIGDIGFYTTVVGNFQNGLAGFLRNVSNIFESSLYVDDMFALLDTQPIIIDAPHALALDTRKPPVIEFRNVDFVYPGTRKKILHNFSLTIKPGERIAFVGENGAGKSTIIKLLARLYDVTSGGIYINGHNICDVRIHDIHLLFGILFQDFNRYEYPVTDNIRFGRVSKAASQKDIAAAARNAAAHTVIAKLKNGYNQVLGRTFEDGTELSGGQWQKIALARAFYRNAPVLVLDEPTASIDARAESEIFERVERLAHGRTTIIISHRFSTVRTAHTIYVIDRGAIIESGTHDKLMENNGMYSSLFSLQAKGYQ